MLLEAEIAILKAQKVKLESDVKSLQAEILELRSAVDITLVAVSFSRTEDTSSLLQYWIDRANETVYVMVMLITQDELAAALIDAYERGVEVKVIIDDEWLYASGSDYQRILDAGIDIRDDNRAGLMHHKVMIIDGYVVVTGSYNWSWSAEESNDENVIILKSSVIAQAYLEEFNRIWEGTVKVTREEEEVVTLHVVINEVEQNPAGTDYGYEWVELYNPTDQPVDIGGWTLSTTHGVTVTLLIPDGPIIYPGEYLVYSYTGQWLDNEDESVILRDASGIIVDETPLLNDPYNDDWAWSRHPNGIDTDSALDWVFQPSTMGYANL
jgi:sugar-specific transcriptional regulator TrmB